MAKIGSSRLVVKNLAALDARTTREFIASLDEGEPL